MKLRCPILLLTLLTGFSLKAQNLELYEKRTYTNSEGEELPYRILYPENYHENQEYPLVLFLHGAGERGNDNALQLKHGAELFLKKENREQFPAIVVFPQCAREDYWAYMERTESGVRQFPYYAEPGTSLGLALELLNELIAEEGVDEDRLYLMGLSMGGMGTFETLARLPVRFAAAAPICGGGNTDLARLYAQNTDLWIFHGAEDVVVSPELSRAMYERLQTLGANVKYTEYPGVNHNSWENAFAEPDLLPWLFSKKREKEKMRYQTEIFDEVEKSTHFYAFKDNEELLLDFYQPVGDEMSERPLLLYVHGGGFSGGQRDGENIQRFSEKLAKRGFAVASMSYRLTMQGEDAGFGCDQAAANKILTFQKAVEDIRDATDLLLKEKAQFRIDPDRIVISGSSAGAEAVIHAAYWSDADLLEDSPELPDGFRYAGVISMAGALVDADLITPETAIPTQIFHGTCDNLVPYATAPHHYCSEDDTGYLMLDGGLTIANRLRELGKPYYLVTGCTGGHEWAGKPLNDHVKEIVDFMTTDVMQGEFRQIHEKYEQGKDCSVGEHPHFCD